MTIQNFIIKTLQSAAIFFLGVTLISFVLSILYILANSGSFNEAIDYWINDTVRTSTMVIRIVISLLFAVYKTYKQNAKL